MKDNILINDFRFGQIDDQFRYRSDMGMYNASASKLENVVPMRAGGLRLRSGLVKAFDAAGAERIIPFCKDADIYYLLVLSLKENPENATEQITRIDVYKRTIENEKDTWTAEVPDGLEGPWNSSAEIQEVQYAQDNDKVIFVQKDHPPYILSNSLGWSCSVISLDTATGLKTAVTDAEGHPTYNENGEAITQDYEHEYGGLFTTRDFPTTVTFAAGRLIFANSKEHPYRIWISQSAAYNNFQTVKYYNEVDENITTENYLKAIEDYTSRSEDKGDGTEIRVTKEVKTNGIVIITTGTYNKEDNTLIGKLTTKTIKYTEPTVKVSEIITDSCAMELDIASDRNERIAWLGYVGNSIIVGSASSEWAMPARISPTSAEISKVASYGSMDYGTAVSGARNVFYIQSGRRKIRSIFFDQEGFRFIEPSYQCEELLTGTDKKGVKELHWQRVQDPRLYALMHDGSISVLSYDPEYGMNAWVRWVSEGVKFLSLCILDTEIGQEVFALIEKDSVRSIQRFSDDVYTDDGAPFKATIITNSIDNSQVIMRTKKVKRISLASGKTEFKASQDGLTLQQSHDYSQDRTDLPVWTRPTNRDMRIHIESIPGQPFVVQALIVELEVN